MTNLGFPAEQTSSVPRLFVDPVLQSLARYDKEGKLSPLLATSWETDAEAMTITYELREGVQFHDGTDFNAETAKWNIEKYIEVQRPETASIDSMEVLDDHTLKLNLKEWNSSALDSISFFVQMISPTAYEENGKEWAIGNPVGTGPFVFDNWERSVSISYVRNEDYWEEGKPYLDKIVMSQMMDEMTAVSSLRAGEIDGMDIDDSNLIKELDASGNFNLVLHDNGIGSVGQGLIGNSSDPDSPFSNVKVRKALGYAIDVEALNKTINQGYAVATNQWGVPGSFAYNPDVKGYPYNPEKAKELLKEAGYPNGFSTKFYSEPKHANTSAAIQNYLAQVGIDVEVVTTDSAKIQEFYGSTWDGLIYWWHTAQGDLPLYMGRHLNRDAVFYAGGMIHPEKVLNLLNEAKLAKDRDEKQRISYEIQKSVFDEYAIGLPMFIPSAVFAKNPNVHDDGFHKTNLSSWTPENAWIEE
ncbi:peptide/nickel transport system substrate-binding protein [Aquibacillus albus]|uniref:Peptide/nickel transport system substrate-binding protein n=2 Tax=Aquibacillus albus TaxID=1168171 RepID=A0ABS2N4H4_9BACI|nr:peptide/nickel transport system substrate-binding protein [Aquibacillus albus]